MGQYKMTVSLQREQYNVQLYRMCTQWTVQYKAYTDGGQYKCLAVSTAYRQTDQRTVNVVVASQIFFLIFALNYVNNLF